MPSSVSCWIGSGDVYKRQLHYGGGKGDIEGRQVDIPDDPAQKGHEYIVEQTVALTQFRRIICCFLLLLFDLQSINV